MYRIMVAGTTVVALFVAVTAAYSRQGGNLLLDKKESFTDKDETYKSDDPSQKFVQGNPCKVYKLKLNKGDMLTIRMKSQKLDSWVVVEDDKKKVLGHNDDEDQTTLNSKLIWTVPENGEYSIIATCLVTPGGSMEKYGEFQLTVEKAK